MNRNCQNPECLSDHIIKSGFYHRCSDARSIQRFRCKDCHTTFSEATATPTCGQKKRRLNHQIFTLLASGASQNRLAILLQTTRKTIARKLAFLGQECARRNKVLQDSQPLAEVVQFNELETFEHSKCKPLSVALAVEEGTRRILGIQVSSMPAQGHLARISRAKYGKRKDERAAGLLALFAGITSHCADKLRLLSEPCPRYAPLVQAWQGSDPERKVEYSQTNGTRDCVTGQGELTRWTHDPLFSLNHTCAMLHANVNRLFHHTWNTTKKALCLEHHLHLYAYYHNSCLLKAAKPAF